MVHCHSQYQNQGKPIDIACWLSSLGQLVEHRHKKLSVVGLSSTGVHIFFHFLSLHTVTDIDCGTDYGSEPLEKGVASIM